METSLRDEGKGPCGWSTLAQFVFFSVIGHVPVPLSVCCACSEPCQGPSPPAVSQDTWRCPISDGPFNVGNLASFPEGLLGHVLLPSGSQEARGWGCDGDKGRSFPSPGLTLGGRGGSFWI